MRLTPFLVLFLLAIPLFALEKVSLQLKWHHQFQFAGYYAALEKGYYREEGLDVTLKNRDLQKNNIEQVLNGESQYGIGDSVLLLYQAQKKPIVMIAPIFQHSPNVLITLKSSGIDSPYKLAGKRISMYPNDADGLPILAMLKETGVMKQGFKRIQTNFDINELTSGKADAIHGYATNEPYLFRQKGFEVNTIYPHNFGVDFYGDILFTTKQEAKNHPARVAAMKRATIKGWEYAIEHKEEIIRLIQTKYHSDQTTDKLLYEADGIIAAIAPTSVPIGTLNQGRLDFIYTLLLRHGLIESIPIDDYIYRDAQTHRLALMEHVSLDRIIYIGILFLTILAILAYYTRQLRQREHELSNLSDSLNRAQGIAHLGNWEWDIKHNTIWWSDEIYRIFGFEPKAFQANYETFMNHVHPDDREMVQQAVNRALKENIEYNCMHRIVLSDGTQRYVLEEGVVQRDEHHNPVKMIGTVHDITERKKTEILLSQKEGSLQTLLNSVAEGIYGVDVNGYCTFVNRSFLRILGFD
ncbi:MAG TPA: ABC transporter substrate-binding protein, partial [Sulfuricurvum sp.]|nr:ABC transporter substrate-binding protein [Sulfuricurvum sp.]